MENENSEYFFEKLDENKIDDLLFLFKEVFNSFPSKDEIADKHKNCHGQEKFIGYIAYDRLRKKPAAFYGVFPSYAIVKGQKILIAQSGDTMTHPSHQKKGLFFQLAKKTYEFCLQNEIKMIFGFPNSVSHPLFINKLGFSETKQLVNSTLFENKLEVCRFSQKNKTMAKIHDFHVKCILLFFSRGKYFQNSNAIFEDEKAYMLHDSIYHKWKSSTNKFFLKIHGVNVWISCAQNQIAIGDIELINELDLEKVLRKLKILTFLLGYRFLSIGGSEDSYLIKLLEGKYEQLPSYTPIFLDLSDSLPHSSFLFLNSDVDVF